MYLAAPENVSYTYYRNEASEGMVMVLRAVLELERKHRKQQFQS